LGEKFKCIPPRKNSENEFFPKDGKLEKLMVPSESAPQELSNE
jgi:hypothetical protein